MKRCILVTGAAGFLGGRTAKFLAEYFGEYQIVATSRRDTRALEFINHNCHFVPGDLCNFEFCESVLKHTEIVIHCAALSAPFGPYESFYQSNYIATKTYTKNDNTTSITQIQYFDGLGRPIETVQKGITPSGKELRATKP